MCCRALARAKTRRGAENPKREDRKRRHQSEATAATFVSLSFEPVKAYQLDWSHEIVLIDGVTVAVKVASLPGNRVSIGEDNRVDGAQVVVDFVDAFEFG
ncbi:MAG: hypothetical protein AAFR84_20570 [Pseudomonadota bacterium]